MPAISLKRNIMTLYSSANCPLSHRVRMVFAEKHIPYEKVEATEEQVAEDLGELNPYASLPTLIDRELVIFNSQIIMTYLDERYPHPPLMPVDPVSKAQLRMLLYRIETEWYGVLDDLKGEDEKKADKARKSLLEGLITIAPALEDTPYPFLMSETFTLIDCTVAPLLWRLPSYGISLPRQARAVEEYAERLFARECFQESLTDEERELR
ncbi:MAG: stringent starvation protein A [Gammaproteobacteria bacterium]|nr:MAG: stringent starvation protein A [Gammaproteobacteria bacterium]